MFCLIKCFSLLSIQTSNVAPFRERENMHLMFICICILAAAYVIISRGLKSALSFLFLKKELNKSLLFMNLYRIARIRWGCGVLSWLRDANDCCCCYYCCLCVRVLIFPLRICYAQRQNPILKTDFLQRVQFRVWINFSIMYACVFPLIAVSALLWKCKAHINAYYCYVVLSLKRTPWGELWFPFFIPIPKGSKSLFLYMCFSHLQLSICNYLGVFFLLHLN